jgi:hypothetical protein
MTMERDRVGNGKQAPPITAIACGPNVSNRFS